jgi:hypothetical protein
MASEDTDNADAIAADISKGIGKFIALSLHFPLD